MDDDEDLLDLKKWRAKNERPQTEGNVNMNVNANLGVPRAPPSSPKLVFVGEAARNKPKQKRIKLSFD